MIVERTLDVGVVLDVLVDPVIFNAISEDGMTYEQLKIDVIDNFWLKITEDTNLMGCVQFKPIFNKCWDAHIHILPEFRKRSKEAGALIWKWVEDNLIGLIYANIPVFCPNVREFLLSFGFEDAGYLKNAWFKNGKQNDMWILTKESK